MIQGKWRCPWHLDYMKKKKDIHSLLQHFDFLEINHTFREVNRATCWVDFVGHLISDSMNITR